MWLTVRGISRTIETAALLKYPHGTLRCAQYSTGCSPPASRSSGARSEKDDPAKLNQGASCPPDPDHTPGRPGGTDSRAEYVPGPRGLAERKVSIPGTSRV